MRTITLTEIQKILKPHDRIMALDISASSIGVAVATISIGVSTPLETIARKGIKADAASLNRLLDQYPSALIVIGWPLNMDGTEGKRCQSVKDSATEIMKYVNQPAPPVLFWDERLSTEDGERLVDNLRDKQGKLTNSLGKKTASKARDHLAAKVILDGVMESLDKKIKMEVI
jgi:putative Holliday junction resolvase